MTNEITETVVAAEVSEVVKTKVVKVNAEGVEIEQDENTEEVVEEESQ